jgi:ABC-type transport system involved in cytochrome bd biosynthesis fused ATPase/permease subunit
MRPSLQRSQLLSLARSVWRELLVLSALRFTWLCAFPVAFYWVEKLSWSLVPIVLGFVLDGIGQVLSQRLRRTVRARCFEQSSKQALDKAALVPGAGVESAFWGAHLTEFAVTVDLPAIAASVAALITVGALSFLRLGAAFVLPAAAIFALLGGLTLYAHRTRAPLLDDIVKRRVATADFLGAAARDTGEITGGRARGQYRAGLLAFVDGWSTAEDRFERRRLVQRGVIGLLALGAFVWLASRYGLHDLSLRDGSNLLLLGSALPIARLLAFNVDSLLVGYAALAKLELPNVRERPPAKALPHTPRRLSISALRQRFDARLVVDIPHLELDLSRPLLVGGANGAGKTTLVAMIAGALARTEGSIRLDELDAASVAGDDIAFVPQHPVILPELSIAENVDLVAPGIAHRQIATALERLGLSRSPSQAMGELSRGEQQRVAIARALLKEPKLLILDEPDAWLDEGGRRQLLRVLDERPREMALIVVTHRCELRALGGTLLTLESDHSFAVDDLDAAPTSLAPELGAGSRSA